MGAIDNIISVQLKFSDENFLQDISKLTTGADNLSKSAEKAMKAFNNSDGKKGIQDLQKALTDYTAIAQDATAKSQATEDEMRKLDEAFKAGEIDVMEYGSKMAELSKNKSAFDELAQSATDNANKIKDTLGEVPTEVSSKFESSLGKNVESIFSKVKDSATNAFDNIKSGLEKIDSPAHVIETTMSTVGGAITGMVDKIMAGTKTTNPALEEMASKIKEFGNQVKDVAPAIGSLQSAMDKVKSGSEAMAQPIMNVLGEGIGKGAELAVEGLHKVGEVAMEVGKEAVHAFLDLDQKVGQAGAVMGNTLKDGTAGFDEFMAKAKAAPASLEAMVEGGMKLSGTMKEMSGKDLYDFTKALEDSTVALGGTTSDVEHFATSLGEMSAKGVLTAQQMNMLTNTNAAFAKKLKETVVQQSDGKLSMADWSEEMKKGEVSADAVTKAISSMGVKFKDSSSHVTSFQQLFGNMKKTFEAVSWEAISSGLKDMGINLDDVAGQFSKFEESLNIEAGVKVVTGGLKEIISVAQDVGNQLVDGFMQGVGGMTGLEDAGKNVSKAFDTLKTGVTDLLSSFNNTGVLKEFGSLMGDVVAKGADLLQKALYALQPLFSVIGSAVGNVLVDAFKQLKGVFDEVTAKLKPLFDEFHNFATQVAPIVQAAVEIIGKIFTTNLITYVKVGVDLFINTLSAGFHLIEGLVGIVQGAIDIIVGVFKAAWDLITLNTDAFGKDLGTIFNGFDKVFSGIKKAIDGALEWVSGFITEFTDMIGGLVGIVQGVWDTITGIFGGGKKMVDGAKADAQNNAKSIDVGAVNEQVRQAIQLGALNVNAMAEKATALTQPAPATTTTINITGSKQDARAIADQLKRLNII